MSVTVDPELIRFKNTVGPALGDMQSALTDLSDRMTQFKSSTDSFKDGFSSMYSSENKVEVVGKIDDLTSVLNSIATSLESDLSACLSAAEGLVGQVGSLESLKNEIDSLERQAANHSGRTPQYDEDGNITNAAAMSEYQALLATISSKEAEFNRLQDEAISALNSLKGMDASLDFVSEFPAAAATATSGPSKENLTGGTFEKKTFTATNGVNMSYYLYVPEYSTDVGEVPVHMYLHGQDENVIEGGLPNLLNSGQDVNGIVICPQLSDDYKNWENADVQKALIELTDNVVTMYSGDEDKISLSGFSIGAVGGYKLVEDNPDYFSAFIPIAGSPRVVKNAYTNGEKLQVPQELADINTSIWAFYGEKDSYATPDDVTIQQLKKMGKSNVDAYEFVGKDAGHGYSRDNTFNAEYTKDGEMVNPLDWAFEQRKQG